MKTNEIGNDTTSPTTTGCIDTKWLSSVSFSFSSLEVSFYLINFFSVHSVSSVRKFSFATANTIPANEMIRECVLWMCGGRFCSGRALKATDEYIIIISYRDEFWIQPKYQTSHWPTHISHFAACAACAVPTNFFLLRFTPHSFLVSSTSATIRKARRQNFCFVSMLLVCVLVLVRINIRHTSD